MEMLNMKGALESLMSANSEKVQVLTERRRVIIA